MISAVDGIEVAGQSHPDLLLVVADRDGGGPVVDVVVDADVASSGRMPTAPALTSAPVRRVGAGSAGFAVMVNVRCDAVAHLDAGAPRALHERQAFRDVVQLRVGDGALAGDHEVVGHTVHGHSQVGREIVTAGTDLVRDDDPCTTRGSVQVWVLRRTPTR